MIDYLYEKYYRLLIKLGLIEAPKPEDYTHISEALPFAITKEAMEDLYKKIE